MFETRKELQSQLEASQAEVARLEADLTKATALADEAATLAQQVAELTEDLDACRAEMTTEIEAHTATQELLAAEQAKTTPEAIQALVTAEIAKSGIPPIEGITEPSSQAAGTSGHEELSGIEKAIAIHKKSKKH